MTTGTFCRRTAISLSDGRELIYFDETPDADRDFPDLRDLPAVEALSQARFDALTGRWVGIAGHRQARTYHPPAGACPLCPATGEFAGEIPSPDYDVVVFENRFPSFAGTGSAAVADGLFTSVAGTGRCEVVCFTSDHDATFSRLPASRVRTVVEAWHQAPVHHGRDDFWMHLEVFSIRRASGKLKYLAGSESAMDSFVNDVTPEAAAARLREVRVQDMRNHRTTELPFPRDSP